MATGERILEVQRVAPTTEKNYLRSLRYLVDATGDRVPENGTEIRLLHKQIAFKHGKSGANSALKLLRKIMKSMHSDDADFPPWPAESVRGVWAPEPPRESRLTLEQIPLVWGADLPEQWSAWLRFTLLTGMRKSETQRACLKAGEIVVEHTKNHSKFRIPATDAIEKYANGFSGIRCFKPFTRHLESLTGVRITPHDLRRTFASVARTVGVQQNTISWLMNHKSGRKDQTSTYQGRPENFVMENALLAIEHVYQNVGCSV